MPRLAFFRKALINEFGLEPLHINECDDKFTIVGQKIDVGLGPSLPNPTVTRAFASIRGSHYQPIARGSQVAICGYWNKSTNATSCIATNGNTPT